MSAERVARALRFAESALSEVSEVSGDAHDRVLAPVLESIRAAEAALLGPRVAAGNTPEPEGATHARIRELEHMLRAYDEFLSTLGHELRNPLSPLFMQAQYLLDTARTAEGGVVSTAWLTPRLQTFCRRLQKFVGTLERIMDVSRISAGRLAIELEDVDLSELVHDSCAGLERELALARSELETDIAPHVTGVWDRMRLEQIFSNLLSNAIRYGAGKPIVVSLTADEVYARLSVRDFGIGIAEEDQPRIFRRFERLGARRASGGFGIGLWIVHESVVAMGGTIEVTSKLGSGSTFLVTLPRRPGATHE
jgi:signal transduction histidine kinase